MSGASVGSFFMAAACLATTVAVAVMLPPLIEADIDSREGRAVAGVWATLFWTVGLTFTAGHLLAGVGLGLEQPWGKAAAWMMMPWTLLFVPIGTAIGIYQMAVLPRHA